LPLPGAGIDDGLKVTVTPVGCPEAVNAIAELNAPLMAVVIIEVPLLPCCTETSAGEADMLKLAAATVNVTVVDCMTPPPVPVTVMGYTPGVAVVATIIVMVEEPLPGAGIEVGLKLTVTPAGCPEEDNAIAESKVPEIVVVIVEAPLTP
jgi:hypothetical protein